MKKNVFIIVCLFASFMYAATPLADVDTITLEADASVTFGANLNTGETGFLNETNIDLQLHFLPPDMTHSTIGYGLWGELILKLDGEALLEVDGQSGTIPTFKSDEVIIDKAVIHIYDAFVGIESGDFDYGDEFNYPYALGYDNEDTINGAGIYYKEDDPSSKFGYYQGFSAGYANDIFSVEGSVRTQREYTTDSFVYIEGENNSQTDDLIIPYVEGELYTNVGDIPYRVVNGNWVIPAGESYRLYIVDEDSAINFTNNYAVGLYSMVTPIDDLLIGLGGAYAISGTRPGDFSVFAGTQYKAPIGIFSLTPVLTYNLFGDFNEGTNVLLITESIMGFGINFGWGEATEGDSLLYDFYDNKLAYVGTPDSKSTDDGDGMLLPGVSLFTSIDFLPNGLQTKLPFLFMLHTGDIVQGLNAQVLFSTNFGSNAGEVLWNAGQKTAKDAMNGALNKLASQVGLAVDYDIPVGDLTITPAMGLLFGYAGSHKGSDVTFGTSLLPVVEVQLAGLVSNTVLALKWDNFSYSTGTSTIGGIKASEESMDNGVLTLKAEIAL